MAEIQPFRAYRYDTNRVALADVLTQPYDKITPAMQARYYAASPYNLIPIEKGSRCRTIHPRTASIPAPQTKSRSGWRRKSWSRMQRRPFTFIRRSSRSRNARAACVSVSSPSPRGGLRRASCLPARAHAVRSQGRSNQTAPPNTRADRPAFFLYDDPARQIDGWLEQIVRTSSSD